MRISPAKLDVDLDVILVKLGELGTYQIVHYVLLVIIVVISSSAYLGYVFTAGQLDYRCMIPECDADQLEFLPDWVHNAVPFEENGKPAKCLRFQYMADQHEVDTGPLRCDELSFNRSQVVSCDELIFETDEVNIVREFNLTCNGKDWQLALIGSLGYLAELIVLPVSAFMSDKYGRRPVLIATLLLSGVCGITKSFAIDYSMFATMEFVTALVSGGTYMTVFVIAIEMAGPSKRIFSGTLISVSYSLCQSIPGIVAMLYPNFRTFLRILYVPNLCVLTFIWMVPESVRWLLSKGKLTQARETILRAAEMNKVQLSTELLATLNTDATKNDISVRETSTTKDEPTIFNLYSNLLHSKVLCVRLAITLTSWFLIKFIYYGMTIQSVSLFGNKYINYILVNIVEVPAIILNAYLMHWFGRKRTLSVSLLLTGVACVATEFIPEQLGVYLLIVFLVGKCCATIAFTTLYLMSSELWPTSLRHSMMNACQVIGTLGSIIAPFTTLLLPVWSGLPLFCFAGSALVSGFMVLQLPETLNSKLPETLEDAEQLGKTSVTIEDINS